MIYLNQKGEKVESFYLTNEDLIAYLSGEIKCDENTRQQITKMIIDRFKYNCCKRPGETNDDLFARNMGRYVNGEYNSLEKTGELLSREHRTLQTEIFRLFMKFIEKLSENKKKNFYDDRNEWACNCAEKIIDALKKEYLYF